MDLDRDFTIAYFNTVLPRFKGLDQTIFSTLLNCFISRGLGRHLLPFITSGRKSMDPGFRGFSAWIYRGSGVFSRFVLAGAAFIY
jgi:hypothetical protein